MKMRFWIVPLLLIAVLSLSSCGANRKAKTANRSRKPAPTRTERPPSSTRANALQAKYASELSVSPQQIKNMKLYKFGDDWKGTRYQYGGMSRSGVDCSGFSNILYKEVYNHQLPRTTREIYKNSKVVHKSSLREGDLVFFDISGKKSSHMGVYLQNNYFVHASSSKGVVISHLDNTYYKKYFDRGGRVR